MSNVVLVTGCSKGGIGYEICLSFQRRGHKVFATARNLQKLEGLPSDIGQVQMDVTDESSIEKAVKVTAYHARLMRKTIIEETGRIGVSHYHLLC